MPLTQRPESTAHVLLLIALTVAVALSRLLPHPPNFSPVEAVALFGGAVFASRYVALLVPLAAMLLSDAFLGFHSGMWLIYGCMAVIALAGTFMRGRITALRVLGSGIGAAVFFFVVTNFAVWAGSGMYALSFDGLLTCYVAAIPFFANSLAGVLVYSLVLFGAHALLTRRSALTTA